MNIEVNNIYNMDCLTGMKYIPDKSVDMILCDLPYGTTNLDWDKVINQTYLWSGYKRIIKDNGAIVLTGQQPFTTDLINSARDIFRYEIIWHKTQALGFLDAKKKPLRAHENILVFYKKLPTYNPQKTISSKGTTGHLNKKNKQIRFGIYNKNAKKDYYDDGTRYPTSVLNICNWNGVLFGRKDKHIKHPTSKPVALFEWFVKTYTNEGDVVLDNCMGSGTTAIACINTKRKYIGFEINEEYYKYSIERIHSTIVEKNSQLNFD
jgi:site-specific DNA-methyltransferase (adenine-specific)